VGYVPGADQESPGLPVRAATIIVSDSAAFHISVAVCSPLSNELAWLDLFCFSTTAPFLSQRNPVLCSLSSEQLLSLRERAASLHLSPTDLHGRCLTCGPCKLHIDTRVAPICTGRYRIPHVARDVQAPFLGPRGTGGSELLKLRADAREVRDFVLPCAQPVAFDIVSGVSDLLVRLQRVDMVLQRCEDKAQLARMKEAATARQASWLAAKNHGNAPHSARF
jgi:hypothetical protein